MIRRTSPLPTDLDTMSHTLRIARFPTTSTLDEIQEFIDKYGKSKCIRMRKDKEKKFKGSIYVEMSTKEECEKLLSEELKYSGEVLAEKCYLQDHLDSKKAKKPKKKSDGNNKKEEYEPGCVLRVKNIGEGANREDFEAVLNKKQYQFIDFCRGQTEGYLRFKKPDFAKETLEKFTSEKPVIGGNEIEVSLVEGDEEKEYWEKISDLRNQKKQKGGQKRGGGGNKRGRRGSNEGGKNKKAKTEEGGDDEE